MTNPIDAQSADGKVFIGSREKADNSFGQNGFHEASSLLPGQTKPNIKNVSPPTVSVPDGSWQTRDVSTTPL